MKIIQQLLFKGDYILLSKSYFWKLFELNPSEHKLYFELPNFKNLENKVNELLNKGVEFPKPNNNVLLFRTIKALEIFQKLKKIG